MPPGDVATKVGKLERVPKQVDQFHKVTAKPGQHCEEVQDISKSVETEMQARAHAAEHEKAVEAAKVHWRKLARSKDWDSVKADLSVYRYSGVKVNEDPRRGEEYRSKVVDGHRVRARCDS